MAKEVQLTDGFQRIITVLIVVLFGAAVVYGLYAVSQQSSANTLAIQSIKARLNPVPVTPTAAPTASPSATVIPTKRLLFRVVSPAVTLVPTRAQ